MIRGADRQRARVYAWEDTVVTASERSVIPFALTQGIVDAIWSELGLLYSPKVERLPSQARRLQADGSRLRLRFPEITPSWLLLHELAHALSSAADGTSDGHGPDFMGLYIQLLARYLRLPAAGLIRSAVDAGIAVHPDARPLFVDPPAVGLPSKGRGAAGGTSLDAVPRR
ncbi:MAG: hypothetical protein M3N26_02075 [Pseudomonadota bacterium]|nr:hypothetical protein [Pseudomonadota bacterium]